MITQVNYFLDIIVNCYSRTSILHWAGAFASVNNEPDHSPDLTLTILHASAEGALVVPVEGALLPKHCKRGRQRRVWLACVGSVCGDEVDAASKALF